MHIAQNNTSRYIKPGGGYIHIMSINRQLPWVQHPAGAGGASVDLVPRIEWNWVGYRCCHFVPVAVHSRWAYCSRCKTDLAQDFVHDGRSSASATRRLEMDPFQSALK